MSRRRSSLKRQSVRRFERQRAAYLKHRAWTFVDSLRVLQKALAPGGSLHASAQRFALAMRQASVTVAQASRSMKLYFELDHARQRCQLASLLYGVDGVAMLRRAQEKAKTTELSLRQAVEEEFADARLNYDPYPRFVEFGVASRAMREGREFERAMRQTAKTLSASGGMASISRHESEPDTPPLDQPRDLRRDPHPDHSARRPVRD